MGLKNKDEHKNKFLDDREIENILYGRVDPHIYAFSTNTIPNYLKVGDTCRPLETRMEEWRERYPNLKQVYSERALVDDGVYFRDYSVHKYLEKTLNKHRIADDDIEKGIYFSNEFFKDTSKKDVEKAIKDIKEKYHKGSKRYDYYRISKITDETDKGKQKISAPTKKIGPFELRDNQETVVKNYNEAVNNGETNLLLYAVMRFGKSFTAMNCDKNTKVIYIVSAKASDVRAEWEHTIKNIDNFKDYDFITEKELKASGNKPLIDSILKKGRKVAVFLTLQDLQGAKIKNKHKEIFKREAGLLIVDETHFGARAEEYGAVLRNKTENKRDKEENTLDEVEEAIKVLKAKVTLHLSGTPYKILMGSEFNEKNIIGRVRFSDILAEKENWRKKHFLDIEHNKENPDTKKPYKESDNPYFGFPEMVRFAFNPNESSRKKLSELRAAGRSCAVSELFLTDSKGYFNHEQEVLEFLQAIDGSKNDPNIFSFLNSQKITSSNMCRHIVFVLPRRKSCDALEKLIIDNKRLFKNLSKYKILNIAGLQGWKKYKTPNDIKETIEECESNNEKTITLTVNRMMTGSTVKEWDTMIYLKSGSSPQDYDQAIYRIQNQYVCEVPSDDGKSTIKIDKKPQTLLIDFEPNRMFELQVDSIKATINKDKRNNDELKKELRKELKFSKILIINKDKIQEVTENDIVNEINEYAKKRSIVEEVNGIPVSEELFNNEELRTIFEQQPLFESDGKLRILPNKNNGEESDIDAEDTDSNGGQEEAKKDVSSGKETKKTKH